MLEARHAAYRDTPIPVVSAAAPASIRVLPAATRFSLRAKGVAVSPPPQGKAAGADRLTEGGRPAAPTMAVLLDLPINRFAASGERLIARLGPDEWLVLGSEDDGTLASDVEAALAGRFSVLVDVSHRNVAFEVSGRDAAGILNAGCPLDLHPSAFPVGAATRTLLGKAEIVLMRTGGSVFRVECWRSFATYVHGFLVEAALGA